MLKDLLFHKTLKGTITMPRFNILSSLFLLLILTLLLTGCQMLSPRATESEEVVATQEDGLPEWLLPAHHKAEDATKEEIDELFALRAQDDKDDKDDLDLEAQDTEPETVTETQEPEKKSIPETKPDPTAANSDSNNDQLSASEKNEINQAKEVLRNIEKSFKNADSEEKTRLAQQYNHLIKTLNEKYGIVYDNKLEDGEWWQLDRDTAPTFKHDVN